MKIPSSQNSDLGICSFNSSSLNRLRGLQGLLVALVAACVFLTGCAAARLKADYRTYERSYAEGSNRQMLLNLARLDQHHPTYFFKLGQVNTTYRMAAGLGSNAQFSPQGNIGGVTGGGTPSLTYEQNPQWNFIPVNDDQLAQTLLKPVPAEFFYMFYQQGWRVDQLLRLMVDRIEIHVPGREVQIIRNAPSNDPEAVDSYVTFLRISAIALELQRRGLLVLGGETRFVPLAKGWTTKDLPGTKDFLDSVSKSDPSSKNLVWRRTADDKAWEVGRELVMPIFRLNVPEDTARNKDQAGHKDLVARLMAQYQADIEKDIPELQGKPLRPPKFQDEASLKTTLTVLRCGFKLQESVNPEQGTVDEECLSARLVMRSLIGMMSAASQEQPRFDELMNNPSYNFPARVPEKERQPLLRLTWTEKEELTPSLVQLNYLGKTYTVADKATPSALEEKAFWNRDVFRVISQLASQVTVDISKFPLPEILQIRTQ
jgi:hypothetical protein